MSIIGKLLKSRHTYIIETYINIVKINKTLKEKLSLSQTVLATLLYVKKSKRYESQEFYDWVKKEKSELKKMGLPISDCDLEHFKKVLEL